MPLYRACCLALTVTAMTFAIRAGILAQLGQDLGLSDARLGWINAMAFLGFPLATLAGGLFYNALGAKKLLFIAFVGHLLGLGLTIAADGFWLLLLSTFFVGLANGAVEAGCNPLIAQLYPNNKTVMLNRFHVWFPGGIVIGAIASKLMTDAAWHWQWHIAIMLLPTLIYGVMVWQQKLPNFVQAAQNGQNTLDNVKQLLNPLFVFLLLCMTLTATTELGTQQWIERILGASGVSGMTIMALMTSIMCVGRYFGGPLIRRFHPVGVLLGSAIFACIGIGSMSVATGDWIYLSAVLFAMGVTYFWPTMLGMVAQELPQTGALGLSVMGGAGMFAVSMFNPVIGHWIDKANATAANLGLSERQSEIFAGQSVLSNLTVFPAVLIVCFAGLYWFYRKNTLLDVKQERVKKEQVKKEIKGDMARGIS